MPSLVKKCCVAVSALSTFTRLSTIHGLRVPFQRDEKVGVYGFVFFRDGRWVDVVIDEYAFLGFSPSLLTSRFQSSLHRGSQI
jgi:hypothetical protein